MKIRNLIHLLVSSYILIFAYEVSACSCICISHTDYDSILDICSTVNGSQPDSVLSSFVSMHKRMFFGTIKSVEATGDGTETVKVTIDTVIKGQINSNSLTLINIPYKGDCVSSAEFIKGLSFLGYIDSVNLPVHFMNLDLTV